MNPFRDFSIRSFLLGMGLLALILYAPWKSWLCDCKKLEPLAPEPNMPTKNPPEKFVPPSPAPLPPEPALIPPEPVMPRGNPNDPPREGKR